MELGPFASGLVTGLREGVEAALIVSIILAYLTRTGHGASAGRIWVGVIAALVASGAIGLSLYLTVGEFSAPYEQLFEAGTMLLAAGVVTWMLFWMRRQSANVARELRAAVDRAVTDGGLWGLTALAFVAVIREGVETSLFLVGQVNAAGAGEAGAPLAILLGALIGLGIAAALGVGFYQGSRRIDLGRFFRWTGIALIFIAAGLVASATHELIEAGAVTVGTGVALDLSAILPNSAEGGNVVGMLLGALFGYTSTPEYAALVAWLTYLVVVLSLFLRRAPQPARPSPAAASSGDRQTSVHDRAEVGRERAPGA